VVVPVVIDSIEVGRVELQRRGGGMETGDGIGMWTERQRVRVKHLHCIETRTSPTCVRMYEARLPEPDVVRAKRRCMYASGHVADGRPILLHKSGDDPWRLILAACLCANCTCPQSYGGRTLALARGNICNDILTKPDGTPQPCRHDHFRASSLFDPLHANLALHPGCPCYESTRLLLKVDQCWLPHVLDVTASACGRMRLM
jgi:hypothetical protein